MFFNAITFPLKALYKMLTGETVETAVKYIANKVGAFVSGIGSIIMDLVKVISAKLGGMIMWFGRFIWDTVKSLTEKIPNMLSNMGKSLAAKMPRLASNLASIGSVVAESFDRIINWVKVPFEKIATTIGNFFAKSGDTVLTAASKVFNFNTLKGVFLGTFKFLGKLSLSALKMIPFIGSFVSFYFAYKRYKEGNSTGALIELFSGLIGLIPGGSILTGVLSMGLDMINVWRDLSGRTAEEIGANGGKSNWFTKMIDGVTKWVSENLYSWPFIGSIIRSVEHFKAGNWKEGFISMGHSIPLLSPILAFFDIDEKESRLGAGTGGVGNFLKNALSWLGDTIMNLPVIGNIIRAFKQFFSGNFADGLSELGLGSIINAIKNFKFEMPSFGDVGDMLSNAIKFLYDSILDLPIIRNIIQSIKYAASGEWKKAALELLPEGVVSWFKKMGGDKQEATNKQAAPATTPATKSQPNQIKFDQTSTNNLTPQSQKLQLAGLSDLQESLLAMSKQEINLLAEQRNLIKQTNDLLTLIYNTSMTPSDQSASPQMLPGGQTTSTGEPTSVTRGAFQGGKNIMNMGMRQGTLG